MMYKDKDDAVDETEQAVAQAMDGLHPVDEVEALRTVADAISSSAKIRERENAKHGVPEMPEGGEEHLHPGFIEGTGTEL